MRTTLPLGQKTQDWECSYSPQEAFTPYAFYFSSERKRKLYEEERITYLQWYQIL